MAEETEDKRNASNNLALERHMIFLCPECGQTFPTQQEWRQHLNTVHDYAKKKAKDFDFKEIDKKYHECQICLKRLAQAHHSPVILQYHRFSHLTYGAPFRCRYCTSSYEKKRALSVHLFRCHSQLMNKLDNEYKMTKMRQAIALRHPRFNKEFFLRFICPQCGKLFQRFRDWQEHIDKAHANTKTNLCMHRIVCTRDYYCDQCSDTLKNGPTWDQLRRHHFSHLPYPSFFQCAFCLTQKSLKTDLFLHFIKNHRMDYLKNKKYICCPEEWGGPANGETMKQIQIYTATDAEDVSKVIDIRQHTTAELSNKSGFLAKETANITKKVHPYNKQETGRPKNQPYMKQKTGSQKVYSSRNRETGPPAKTDPYTKQESETPKISAYIRQETEVLPKVKDILQKALRDSCINLEEEEIVEDPAIPLQTLQATANRYENMFVVDVERPSNDKPSKFVELNDNELEIICEEMFEEIQDSGHNDYPSSTHNQSNDSKTAKNCLSNDKLKKEMQKYINYLCPECLHEFDNQPDWRTHVFEQHNLTNAVKSKFRPLNAQKTAYLCLTCYQIQRTSKNVDLQRHYFQHMPHQDYLKCTLCVKTKSSKPKMLHHLEHVHGVNIQKTTSRTLQCLECDQTFDETLQLQNHLWRCPRRLEPLVASGQYYTIAKNQTLLKHLQKASQRIDQMLLEVGVDIDSIKFPCKNKLV